MNALCYKIVFSKRLGTLVAVGEHTAGQGKAAGTGVRTVVYPSSCAASADNFVGLLKSVFASVALSFVTVGYATAAGPAVNTLPTGYSVNSGNVAISSTSSATNAAMTIKQTTDKASVNWQSFSIGSGAAVNVQQNNANSVLLNRVVGNDPSQIFGKLTANGQVILINPNGVVFGKGGSVTASAFTASTFGMTDADFLAGKHKFTRNGSTAGVTVEEGARIDTTGYVALMGASVDNQGAITTKGGPVVLASGESVTLPSALTDNIGVPLSGKVRLELLPSTINAMVVNSGTITTEGGQLLMQAAALSDAVASITHTGTIDTTGVQGGAVTLQADHGIIKATGNIKANSKNAKNKGGDIIIGRNEITGVLAKATNVSGAQLESQGGFVETSGYYLKTDGISVKAKDWLLDPTDINIVATATTTQTASTNAGGVTGTTTFQDTTGLSTSEVLTGTIQTAINNGTSVTISTANSAPGANGSGNITIVNKLDFANNSGQNATLTLLAKNGITQNAGATIIQTAGSNNNKVDVLMTSEGLHGGVAGSSTSSKGITLQAAITTNGDVTLNGTTNNSNSASASNAIGVDIKSTAGITAKNISIKGKSESSFGIQSVSDLKASGDITLDGTSKNWVGVTTSSVTTGSVTTGAVTAGGALNIIGHKTTAAGYQGININSAVKGASVAITGDSVDHYGVGVGTSGSVTSTTGDVTIIGTGTGITAGNNASGVQVLGGITAKGKLNITGTKNGAVGGYQGVNLSGTTISADSIELTGTSNVWDAVMFTNANLNATKTLKIDADSTAGKGILFSGGSTNTFTAHSYLVKAKTAVNHGIYFSGTNTFNSTSTATDSLIDVTRTTAGGDTIFNAGTLTINSGAGKANLQTSTTSLGGGIRINGGSTVNTTGDITIGSKNSSNAYTFNQGTINAKSGNLTLLGKTDSASGTMAGVWLQDSAGTAAQIIGTNGANITIDGTNSAGGTGVNLSVNSSANIIKTDGSSSSGAGGNISITGTSASGMGISNAATTVTNTSITTGAKGNITLTGTSLAGVGQGISNSAAIKAAGDMTLTGNSVGGHAVNTGGALEAGGLLKIEGTATGVGTTNIGVYIGNTAKGGTVSMTGSTGGSKGIDINGAVSSTVGKIELTGTGGSNYDEGQGVWTRTGGSLNSAAGVTVKGTATAPGNNRNIIGTQIQGAVTAVGDILIEGKNTGANTPKAGLSIENTIKSKGGNITVTGENTSGTDQALKLTAVGKLLTDSNLKAININTNGIDLATGAVVQAGSAGSAAGTVNIKTTGNNNISVGGTDVGSNTASSQTLGISQAELNQITAGNVLIGDTSKTGNITVSGAVSTGITTGNITLQTGGNISVNNTLAAASGKNLTLQAIGDVAVGAAISQAGAGNIVIAAGLGKLAGDVTGSTNAGSGQVRRTGTTGSISNTGGGKTYIYTGTVADSATMSQLNGAFATLSLGTNAKSNTATDLANTISGGGNTQVMYREKISVNLSGTNTLNGATKTYGDVSLLTVNADAKTALKAINADKTLSWTEAGNTFNLGSNALIDTLSVDGAAYSTAGKLKANGTAYGTSSSTYSVTSPQTLPTLKINVKDVTYSGVGVDSKVYDGTTAALLNGTAAMATVTAGSSVSTDTKVITTDNVTLSGTVAGTFASKNVRGTDNAGANTVTLTGASLSGAEASNYNLVQQAPVTANGKITPQPLTLTGTTVADKTYDGTTSATVTNTGTLNGLVAGETLDVTATGTFNNASVGNQKPVTVTGALADRGGNLATNYRLANAQAIANITAALKPPSPVVPTDSTPRVKIPVGSANPFALASAEDLTDEACTANSIENCYCEPSPLNANVDICYEPKAGAKGAAH